MIRPASTVTIAAVVLLTMIGGCSNSSSSNGSSAWASEQPNMPTGPLRQTTELTTAMPPVAVTEKVSQIFNGLLFNIQTDHLERFGIHQQGSNDFFLATTAALGTNNVRVLVVAKWISDRETSVTFSSDLNPGQHEHVADLIRAAIAAPGR